MQTITILHKGWRANDTLQINDKGVCMLTYYTRRKTNLTTEKMGIMLYKNQRVFSREGEARLFYNLIKKG